MAYKYRLKKENNSLFASGILFRSGFGNPGFPARLAGELMDTCLALRTKLFECENKCVIVYDPCCGAGILLSILGVEYWSIIECLIGSDIDTTRLAKARENLSRLTLDKVAYELEMRTRSGELNERQTAMTLHSLDPSISKSLTWRLFSADGFMPNEVRKGLDGWRPDVVVADLPYGNLTRWIRSPNEEGKLALIDSLLRSLEGSLPSNAIIALVSQKEVQVERVYNGFVRVKSSKIGKRKISYFVCKSAQQATLMSANQVRVGH